MAKGFARIGNFPDIGQLRLKCMLVYLATSLYHYGISWNVTGSIPVGVSGIFHGHNPSGRTVALGSIQSLTEMSTRCISWGIKAACA